MVRTRLRLRCPRHRVKGDDILVNSLGPAVGVVSSHVESTYENLFREPSISVRALRRSRRLPPCLPHGDGATERMRLR